MVVQKPQNKSCNGFGGIAQWWRALVNVTSCIWFPAQQNNNSKSPKTCNKELNVFYCGFFPNWWSFLSLFVNQWYIGLQLFIPNSSFAFRIFIAGTISNTIKEAKDLKRVQMWDCACVCVCVFKACASMCKRADPTLLLQWLSLMF